MEMGASTRCIIGLLLGLSYVSCAHPEGQNDPGLANKRVIISASFDGADYVTADEQIGHGERLSNILACNQCHLPDYRGANFGEVIPLLEGLWATNISLTLPEMTDEELERILRDGVHPTRDMFLMPSKQSQFLSDRDMKALIAFLRTIPPIGQPTPVPPEGFRDSISKKLPPDYWRKDENGNPRYHTSEDEVLYYRKHALPNLREEYAQGKLIAQAVCTSCHGASLDGVGEMSGGIQRAIEYDSLTYRRLLREGVTKEGDTIETFIFGHAPPALTENELQAVMSYTMTFLEDGATQ